MARKRNHQRAEGMTQTTIAIPMDLLQDIDRLAERQLRSRNSLIHWMLREQVDALQGKGGAGKVRR